VTTKPKTFYQHLDGQITTRTRPSGGYIIEVLVPSRKERVSALACIFATEALLRNMKRVLLKGQPDAHQIDMQASVELLNTLYAQESASA